MQNFNLKGSDTMKKANQELRTLARKKGVFLYQIAERMGISDTRLSIKMRKPFSEKQKRQFLEIIEELSYLNSLDDEE